MTMWRYAVEMKAPMLKSQDTHKQNAINAKVSEVDGIQQVQQDEQYE